MIDISKIKPGDFVTVRAKVLGVQDKTVPAGEICIIPDMHDHRLQSWIWVLPSAITGHELAPEPLKIGDMVEVCPGKSQGTIVGLHDGNAWVYVFKQSYLWKKLSELRRVEP